MERTLLPGRPYPLGATPMKLGTNFALFSETATAVRVCFFDENGVETDAVALKERTAFVWHGLVRNIKPGQRYGYRVEGPWDPENGMRFNSNKLLVDPYAKALVGNVDWKKPIFAYDVTSGDEMKFDDQDSAEGVPKSIVVDPVFDWKNDCRPDTPLAESVIYEVHVGGFSNRNELVPEKLRGTYAGLASQPSIDYLKKLGVTAVELLPVHHFIDEGPLVDRGLRDYWGYNTLGYFAPMSRYSSSGDSGGQVVEFKKMVRTLHSNGIEVILDVVYNHTCEGNGMGPLLSMKGIDNVSYYRRVAGQPRYYMDFTGTGNTLNLVHPQVLQLVMDSLRYWVTEMRVDGFRFDLASTLAREENAVSKLSGFFDVIHQDPILQDTKLIAEPWDVGEGGYQVGNFPVMWAEWNGKYRDTVRRFWKGDHGLLSDFAYRFTGSSDLYQHDGRKPYASINFITAHDGFTLTDLVSYNEKHNEANGDNNTDGANDNDSWNMGAEGPTDDQAINELRERQTRNFLTTLLLSQGVPMLCGGDELGRSQRGNNNGYCQDNELTWYDWKLDEPRKRLMEFTSKLIHLRLEHPNLRRRKFFQDRQIRGSVVRDIAWFNADGKEFSDEDWDNNWAKAIAVLLNGQTLGVTDEDGHDVKDDSFVFLINAAPDGVEFTLPESPSKSQWVQVLDTQNLNDPFEACEYSDKVILGGRSMRVFRDGKNSSKDSGRSACYQVRLFLPLLLTFACSMPCKPQPERSSATIVDVDVSSGSVSSIGRDTSTTSLPGSTLKPFVLWTALRLGMVGAQTRIECSGTLRLDGRNLACAHPTSLRVLDAREALAYSCNSYFARLAEEMPASAFSEGLRHFSIAVDSMPLDPQQRVLAALGLKRTHVTPLQLAQAYVVLAREINRQTTGADTVRDGLLDSVTYGMANAARTPPLKLAGKTGTVHDPAPGMQHGWFAGMVFDSIVSSQVRRVVVVYVPGGSGADAATAAHHFLQGRKP